MDSALIEKVYGWAKQRNALLFLDIQVAKSTMQREFPRLMPFLSRPDVHLAMDAEFSMHHSKEGMAPGKKVGVFDANDINWVSEQLAELVKEKQLPPKSHRAIGGSPMILNADKITVISRVQIVMDMDGWGPPWMKFESYRDYIDLEPVEYRDSDLLPNDAASRPVAHGRRSTGPQAAAVHPKPVITRSAALNAPRSSVIVRPSRGRRISPIALANLKP
jgi:hypothetical protein